MTTTVLAYIPSPPQGVWHLGPFPLRAYALCIIVGIVAALVIGDRRWTARGGEPGVIYDVALWAVPFGLIGGRAYHVMTDWRTYFGEDGAGLGAALRIWDGGLGIWGAVALGGVGAWIACRRRGIPLPAFGDAIAPGIILAQAIGRLGNYFNQELFGRETTLPWGLEIYERVNSAGQLDMLNGVSTGRLALDYAVHPTFLYELLWNLLVFAVLILVDRRFRIGHGRLFALYVAGYCVGRFWIELMRSDTATLLAGIRINTFTATFVFIGAVVYIMVAPKGREDPATLRGNVDDEARVEEFAAATVAAATGVAAAAKVAEEDDAADRPEAELEPVPDLEPAESDTTRLDAGGLGTVEGEEAVEAADGASTVHDAAVQGAADAQAMAAELDVSGDVETEADGAPATEEDTVTPPLPSEAGGMGAVEGDEASEAAAGAAAAGVAVASSSSTDEAEPESEDLGSVDGDEVAASVGDAEQVHDAAVAGEAYAEEPAADLAAEPDADADVEAEPDAEPESDGLGSVDGDEVASVGDAEQVHDAAVAGEADAEELAADVAAEPDADADVAAEPDAEPESEGLGSVDGDEVAASVGDAEQVHDVAVAGEADAEELAADVEAEPEPGLAEPDADTETEPESEGLGSVDGDEVAASVGDAEQVHDVAVAGEADAGELAADVDAEPDADADVEAEPDAEPESEGLGSVDGDEVAASVGDAEEVHDAAVAGEADAEELAADVDAEPDADAELDADAEPESGGLGSVDGDEVAASVGDAEQVHDAAVAGEADAEELAAGVAAEPETNADVAAEPDAEPESEGLGSVDGDEVAASVGDAEQVHDAAVAGEADAEELAAGVAAESETNADVAAEPDAEPESEGLGSVDGDEVAASVGDAEQVHDAAVAGEADAGELAADVADEPETEPEDAGTEVSEQADEQSSLEGVDAAEALTADDSSDETTSAPAPNVTRDAAKDSDAHESSRSQRALEAAGRVRQWVRRRRNR